METELSQLLGTLGTIPGLLLIALSCVLMAMKVYSQRLATKAHAEHSERILKANPEQLALGVLHARALWATLAQSSVRIKAQARLCYQV